MITENGDGSEEEAAVVEIDAQADAETVPADPPADEPAAGVEEPQAQAEDAEPDATPEETEKAGDDDDAPLAPDLMDIFESEELVEPTVVIPGLENLMMSEVAAETERVLEEMKSRFLS